MPANTVTADSEDASVRGCKLAHVAANRIGVEPTELEEYFYLAELLALESLPENVEVRYDHRAIPYYFETNSKQRLKNLPADESYRFILNRLRGLDSPDADRQGKIDEVKSKVDASLLDVYCQHLDIDARYVSEDTKFLIIHQYMNTPMPPGWKREIVGQNGGNVVYRNIKSGELSAVNPNDALFRAYAQHYTKKVRWLAARKIQCRARIFSAHIIFARKLRFKLLQVRPESLDAASKIQRNYRIMAARKKRAEIVKKMPPQPHKEKLYQIIMERVVHSGRKKETAIVKLQSTFRGYMKRLVYNAKKQKKVDACVEIQKIMRGYLTRKRFPALRAKFAKMKPWERKYYTKWMLLKYPYFKERREAAVNIQRIARGFMGRRIAKRQTRTRYKRPGDVNELYKDKIREYNLRKRKYDNAAILVQSFMRMTVSRNRFISRKLDRRNNAAVLVQRNYRGHLAREMVSKTRAEREGALKDLVILMKKIHAAVVIQTWIRAIMARRLVSVRKRARLRLRLSFKRIVLMGRVLKSVEEARSEKAKAAATIQAYLRGAKARSDFDRQKTEMKALIQIQRNARGFLARQKLLNKLERQRNQAATKIQAKFRGRAVRKELDSLHLDEEERENIKRKNRVRQLWKQAIRRVVRDNQIRNPGAKKKRSLFEIATYRAKRAKEAEYRRLREATVFQKSKHHRAARDIQRVWRGRKGRMIRDRKKFVRRRWKMGLHSLRSSTQFTIFKVQMQEKKGVAALQIQRIMRGYLGRKEARRQWERVMARRLRKGVDLSREAREARLQALRDESAKENRAATKIQSIWRQYGAKWKVQAMRERAAAIRLQKHGRAMLARILTKSVRRKFIEQRAVLDMQRVYRGFVGRRRKRRLVWGAAVTIIQNAARGMAARKRTRRIRFVRQVWARTFKTIIPYVQFYMRVRELLEIKAHKVRGATVIQAFFRGVTTRRKLKKSRQVKSGWKASMQKALKYNEMMERMAKEKKIRNDAASHIQKVYRGHLGRRRVKKYRIWRTNAMSNLTAIKMQCMIRAAQAKKRIVDTRLFKAALGIQSAFRCMKARRRVRQQRLHINSVRIQRIARGYLERKRHAVRVTNHYQQKGAVEIQRIVRGAMQRKRYKARKSARRHWKMSITRVKLYSGMMNKILADKGERVRAVITLQAAYRGTLGRRRAHAVRYNLAATKIQRIARGVIGRQKAKDYREFLGAVAFQRVWKGYAARKDVSVLREERRLFVAARAIQMMFRSHAARRILKEKREARALFVAAARVQSLCRIILARAAVKKRMLEIRKNFMDRSATTIQTRARVYLAKRRVEYLKLSVFAVKIQKIVRGRQARLNYSRRKKARLGWKNSASKVKIYREKMRKVQADINRKNDAALQIQRLVRGVAGRKEFHELNRVRSAVRIQKVARGHFSRNIRRNLKRDWAARRLQISLRKYYFRNRVRFLREDKATIKIQSVARMFVSRNRLQRLKLEHESSIRIQAAERGRRARQEAARRKEQKHASIDIQRYYRRHLAKLRVQLIRRTRAAILVQKAVRMWLARRAVQTKKQRRKGMKMSIRHVLIYNQHMKQMEEQRVVRGEKSLIIQCAWRQFLARRERMKRYTIVVYQIQRAARTIQHAWGRYLNRQMAKFRAARMIQKHMRRGLARNELWRRREKVSAAQMIQKAFRLSEYRRQTKLNAIIRMQSFFRAKKAKQKAAQYQKKRAAFKNKFLEGKFYSTYINRMSNIKKQRNDAALKIQLMMRCHWARVECTRRRHRRAATIIQRRWRGYITRLRLYRKRTYELHNEKTVNIQRVFRGHQDRKRVKAVRMTKKRQEASVTIQRYGRRHLAKKKINYRRATRAAINIQRVVRGWMGRKEVRNKKKIRTGWKVSFAKVRTYKYMLQNITRIKKTRNESATKIQSIFRGLKGRKRANDVKKERAALKIQAGLRGRRGRKIVQEKRLQLKQQKGALMIQTAYRGKRGRNKAKEVKANKNATRIQANFRGLQGRRKAKARKKRIKQEKLKVAESHYSQVLVERGWKLMNRNWINRKKLVEDMARADIHRLNFRLRQGFKYLNRNRWFQFRRRRLVPSVTIIQAHWRGYVARREARRQRFYRYAVSREARLGKKLQRAEVWRNFCNSMQGRNPHFLQLLSSTLPGQTLDTSHPRAVNKASEPNAFSIRIQSPNVTSTSDFVFAGEDTNGDVKKKKAERFHVWKPPPFDAHIDKDPNKPYRDLQSHVDLRSRAGGLVNKPGLVDTTAYDYSDHYDGPGPLFDHTAHAHEKRLARRKELLSMSAPVDMEDGRETFRERKLREWQKASNISMQAAPSQASRPKTATGRSKVSSSRPDRPLSAAQKSVNLSKHNDRENVDPKRAAIKPEVTRLGEREWVVAINDTPTPIEENPASQLLRGRPKLELLEQIEDRRKVRRHSQQIQSKVLRRAHDTIFIRMVVVPSKRSKKMEEMDITLPRGPEELAEILMCKPVDVTVSPVRTEDKLFFAYTNQHYQAKTELTAKEASVNRRAFDYLRLPFKGPVVVSSYNILTGEGTIEDMYTEDLEQQRMSAGAPSMVWGGEDEATGLSPLKKPRKRHHSCKHLTKYIK